MPATLFDGLTDPPPTRPSEPVFWIRRVVLVEERTPGGRMIRDIPFRRGLNVIRVIDRPKGKVGPVGHSVGKTLLMRFIRYCLGEKFYAIEDTTEQIAGIFRNGYVIAEVVVKGVGWVVARPFAVGGRLASHAERSDRWTDALEPGRIAEPFEAFVEDPFSSRPRQMAPALSAERETKRHLARSTRLVEPGSGMQLHPLQRLAVEGRSFGIEATYAGGRQFDRGLGFGTD